MSRVSKIFKAAGGLCMLFNIWLLFMPLIEIRQENYPADERSQYYYVKCLFTHEPEVLTNERIIMTAVFIIIPILASLIFSVIAFVGSESQIVSAVGGTVTAALNLALAFIFVPGWLRSTDYCKASVTYWLYIFMIAAGLNIVFEICGIIFAAVSGKSRRKLINKEYIPELDQIKEKQNMPKSGFIDESLENHDKGSRTSSEKKPHDVQRKSGQSKTGDGDVKGELFGLAGMYKDAVVPIKDGETISLGRDESNDLVFTGQRKVSRNHCRITWHADKKIFEIVDCSSNGSFVNGSDECIPQNISTPLLPGMILDIGSSENRFRLQ